MGKDDVSLTGEILSMSRLLAHQHNMPTLRSDAVVQLWFVDQVACYILLVLVLLPFRCLMTLR